MSFDLKIQNVCDHTINWERVPFPIDRRTLSPSYPIGARSSFVLRINNFIIDATGYTIYLDKTDLVMSPKSIVYLKDSCKFYYPIVELKYTTLKEYCPKCAGSRVLDDIIYGPNKDVVTYKDEYLLIQTFEKFIVTKINSNKYYGWIGTSLHDLIGTKITDIEYIKTKIADDIRKAVDNLKIIQNQYISTGRYVSPGELFGKLIDVVVSQYEKDPTMLEVLVDFTAQSGKSLELQQLIKLSKIY